jgi:hypothetical protein
MPSPKITWTPLHIYVDREPTFRELAEEQWGVARHRYFDDDTWRDRLQYAASAWRLRSAAKWAALEPVTFIRYFGRHVLLRVVPITTLGLFILYLFAAWGQAPDGAGSSAPEIVNLLIFGGLLGTGWGLARWRSVNPTLAWAKRFRANLLVRQRQLLSDEGWEGWRLIRRDRGYVYVRVDDLKEPSNQRMDQSGLGA